MKTVFVVLIFLASIGCQSVSKPKLVKLQEYPFESRLIIAVTEFENISGKPENDILLKGLGDAVIEELMKYRRFRIVERQHLEKVLDELDLELAGLVEPKNTKKVGMLLGVDALLIGKLKSVEHEENKLQGGLAYKRNRKTDVVMIARLVRVETGEILASSEATAYVKQSQAVAFGLVKSGTIAKEETVARLALDVAVKQLANDLAARTPLKPDAKQEKKP